MKSVWDVVEDLGNPCSEISNELVTLNKKLILSCVVVEALLTIEDEGKIWCESHAWPPSLLSNATLHQTNSHAWCP